MQHITQVDGINVCWVELLSMHDNTVPKKSGVIEDLRDMAAITKLPVCIYGDPAYQEIDVVQRKSKVRASLR